MTVIGLTGGIASGKSTAASFLRERGAHVIDADRLGHRAYEPDTEAFRAVVDAFGEDIVAADGQVDRRALGGKVFGKPQVLKQLTDIVWPEIRRLAEIEIEATLEEDPARLVVLEAAVLLEATHVELSTDDQRDDQDGCDRSEPNNVSIHVFSSVARFTRTCATRLTRIAENAASASSGIVMNPNSSICLVLHETPSVHGDSVSGMTPK